MALFSCFSFSIWIMDGKFILVRDYIQNVYKQIDSGSVGLVNNELGSRLR